MTSVAPTDPMFRLPFLLLHLTPSPRAQPPKPLLSHLLQGWPCSVLSVLSWKEAQISLLLRKPGCGRPSAAGQRISPPGRREPARAGRERSPWGGDIPSLGRSCGRRGAHRALGQMELLHPASVPPPKPASPNGRSRPFPSILKGPALGNREEMEANFLPGKERTCSG